MNLQQLRYFIVLAEELHFQRAAIRIPCAQSSLSAQIAGLEREIGEPLLIRHSRHCELTPAGSRMYLEALRLTHAADRAVDVARGDITRIRQQLRIGVCEEGIQSLMDVLLTAYRVSHPGVEVKVQACEWTAMSDLATQRDADFDAVIWGVDTSLDGLEGSAVFQEPLILLISERSELAHATEIDTTSVLDETMLNLGDFMRSAAKTHFFTTIRNGDEPRLTSRSFVNMDEVMVAVAHGQGCIAPTLGTLGHAPVIPGVRCLPFSNPSYASVGVLIRSDEYRPHVRDFAAMAPEIGRSLFHLVPTAVGPDYSGEHGPSLSQSSDRGS